VRFAAITFYVALKQVFIFVSIYNSIESVRELLDTPSYARCKKEILWSDRKYRTRSRVSNSNLTTLGAKFQNTLQKDLCLCFFAVRSVQLPSFYMNIARTWEIPIICRSMEMVTEIGIGLMFHV